jgi:hypothetical protein
MFPTPTKPTGRGPPVLTSPVSAIAHALLTPRQNPTITRRPARVIVASALKSAAQWDTPRLSEPAPVIRAGPLNRQAR